MQEKILLEWTVEFIKHKDIMLKKLLSISCEQNKIKCIYKYGKHVYYILPHLSTEHLDLINDESITIVCLNKKENVKFILEHWASFIKNKKLSFVFSNPSKNERWIIYPHTHNMIADETSLKSGLLSLFDAVEKVE